MVMVNAYQVLERITEAFICEIQWDTLGKKVYLKERVGEDKGAYFISGLNLKEVTDTFDSYDFATEIIPIGEDGLEITGINGGKNYLSNHQYSAKKITTIWEDSSYTDVNALKEDAEYRLGEISKPKKTVQAKVIDLAKMKPGYGVLSYSVGDTVWLIDQETGTREKQRITKTVEYLDNPEKNTCDISNTVLSFEDMQKKLLAAAECVSNITTGNGTVKGGSVDKIDISQIIGIEDFLTGDLKDITADYIYARKELGAVYAAIGEGDFTTVNTNNLTVKTRADISLAYVTELHADNTYGDYAKFRVVEADNISALAAKVEEFQANNITVEYLKAHYAEIDLANVETQSVANLFVKVGLLESATIVNGHITGYLDSVSINANSIKAGTLSVDRLVLNGTEESLIFALNNLGELTSTHCDTLDGGLLTKKTITADHIVAETITANEIAAGAITADKIAANAITANKIAARAVTADKISVNSLEAIVAKIGGFTIGASYLANNTTALGTAVNSVYLGTDGISCGTSFKVGKTGALNCTSADITGKLTSKSTTDTMVIDAASIMTTNYVNGASYKKTTITSTQVSVGVTSSGGTYLSEVGINIKHNGNSIFSVLDGTMMCSEQAYFFGGLDGKTIYENGTALSNKYQARGSYLETSGGTITGDTYFNAKMHTHSVVPAKDATYPLGASDLKYSTVYSVNFVENGTSLSNKYQAKGSYAAASHTHSYLPLSGGTVTGAFTANGNITTKGNFKCTNAWSTEFHIDCLWKDGAVHNLVTRSADGLTTYLGWAGSASHPSITKIRARTVQYQNSSGTTTLSDERMKNTFEPLDGFDEVYMNLEPRSFLYNNGSSGRKHFGFGAAQVKEALVKYGFTTKDFAGFVQMTDNPELDDYCGVDDPMGLIYTEFVSWNTHMIQKLYRKIEKQQEEIDLLKNCLSSSKEAS